MNNINELSTTSESDNEYLVDSRYCRTIFRCKRKALKKTIKLIHGRCVVVYRGTGDLLPIAAKDADQNCYSDFVFICHDQKVNKQRPEISVPSPRSHSALQDSSASLSSSTTDHDDVNLFKQNPYPFKSKSNNNNNYERTQIVTTPSTTNEKISSHEDIDIDELFRTDKSLPSIVFFPSSCKKT